MFWGLFANFVSKKLYLQCSLPLNESCCGGGGSRWQRLGVNLSLTCTVQFYLTQLKMCNENVLGNCNNHSFYWTTIICLTLILIPILTHPNCAQQKKIWACLCHLCYRTCMCWQEEGKMGGHRGLGKVPKTE